MYSFSQYISTCLLIIGCTLASAFTPVVDRVDRRTGENMNMSMFLRASSSSSSSSFSSIKRLPRTSRTFGVASATSFSSPSFISPAFSSASRGFPSILLKRIEEGKRSAFFPPLSFSSTPITSPSPSTSKQMSSKSAQEATKEEDVSPTIELPTNDNNENLLKIRHTAAHVMAMAMQRLHPEIKVTIGPWIENGFYYDFDTQGKVLVPEDLSKIKKEMERIVKKRIPLTREEVSREEARKRIEALNEPYKLEILDSIKTEPITIYHIGEEWWDLCAGPHVEDTGKLNIKAIGLESLAGAYWRGDESKAMLTRVYGTAWENKDQLVEYRRRMEEAKKRDHRVLGKKFDLFSIQEDAGGGLVFWHPNGSIIRRILEDYWKETHIEDGYELLYTPHMANLDLWKTSGHFDFYQEGMFDQMDVENQVYQIKPMNCPFHCLVYKDTLRSYKQLPIRYAEMGTVYRYEKSGTLHGLMRVRGFTQDDAHIFCLSSQLEDEIIGVLNLTENILSKFGFSEYEIMLSTRPEKSVGTDEIWDKATTALKGALDKKGWEHGIDEGGGAFYGPKIDIKIKDAIGRTWQCSTIQCDFNLPERFDLEYIADDGSRQRPIMVHRAIFGSVERFFGILVESTAGEFPMWMSPVQIRLLPVVDDAIEYAQEVAKAMKKKGIRVEVDSSGQRLAKQIRNAEQDKIPVMAIVGKNEVENKTLSVRTRASGDLGAIPVDTLVESFQESIRECKNLEIVN